MGIVIGPARVVCGFVLALFFLAPLKASSQGPASGFYVIIDSKKNCPNLLTSHDGNKSYCLPKEPVITQSDFESVTEVKYDSLLQLKYIMLTLTANGFKSIKFLVKRLPDSKLALVIEDEVAGIFDSVDKNVGRTIPIRGGINATEVEWVYQRLKKKEQP